MFDVLVFLTRTIFILSHAYEASSPVPATLDLVHIPGQRQISNSVSKDTGLVGREGVKSSHESVGTWEHR